MAKKLFSNEGYKWNYCSVGGVVRVTLNSGEDIAHLGELDQKKWTVLSCPVKGLHMDAQTLGMIDADGDGKIRVAEVVAAANWLTSVVKDKNSILKGDSEVSLDNINADTEEGQKILAASKVVLACLGQEKNSITMEDAANSMDSFNKSAFNGDSVITEAAADDEALKKVIASVVATVGGVQDRSGAAGVNVESIDKFLEACKAYIAWLEAGEAGKAEIFPYADKTADAFAACNAVNSKIADYFMRCKLVKFDDAAAAAVDVSAAKIEAIGGQNLTECTDEIASYPLARPSAEAVLDLKAINPAWQAAMDKAVELVGIKENITEASWAKVMASFGAYSAYMAGKAGAEVESLGADYVKEVLAANPKEALVALIDKDASLAAEAASIASINKFMHLYRDFYRFLNNYVIFTDFYSADRRAIFEAGELYIDERCCKMCVEVADMGKHADMAAQSGMFLIYCTCTSKAGAKKDIVALMTDGDIDNLRAGKNAIFYDLDGNDWDAVVTKVVDNPINIRKAFWSPYRKAANFVSEKINKNMAAKEAASEASMLEAADGKGKQAFDIAKFAGIFAAIGMAITMLLGVLGGFFGFFVKLPWWGMILLTIAVMLVISGPSCFIAWRKLRKRNMGPVLNANGWAINSNVLVNTVFGATLTSVAKYPLVKGEDPFKKKTPVWKKCLYWGITALVIAFGVLYFTNSLSCIGLEYHKGAIKEAVSGMGESMSKSLEEAAAEAAAPAEEVAAE